MAARIVANVQVRIPLTARRNTQVLKAPAVRLARRCLAGRMTRRRTLEAAGVDRGVLASGKRLARILVVVEIGACRRTARRVSVRIVERAPGAVACLPVVRGGARSRARRLSAWCLSARFLGARRLIARRLSARCLSARCLSARRLSARGISRLVCHRRVRASARGLRGRRRSGI